MVLTWLLRGAFCGLVLGILGAKYGWHGLVGGLLVTNIFSLWDVSDTLTAMRDQLPRQVAEISNSIDEIGDELNARLPPRRR